MGFEPMTSVIKKFRPVRDLNRTGLNFFSGLVFPTSQVVLMTAKIAFIFTPLSAIQI